MIAPNGEASLRYRNRAEIIAFKWRTEALPGTVRTLNLSLSHLVVVVVVF